MSTQEQRERIEPLQGALENDRRAKFHRLTPRGRRQLAGETGKGEKLAGAITRILRPFEQEGNP
jgi:PadR family transcriptional regulator, regulatory protein PadR